MATLTVENVFRQQDQTLRKQLFNEYLAYAISIEESKLEILQQVDKPA